MGRVSVPTASIAPERQPKHAHTLNKHAVHAHRKLTLDVDDMLRPSCHNRPASSTQGGRFPLFLTSKFRTASETVQYRFSWFVADWSNTAPADPNRVRPLGSVNR